MIAFKKSIVPLAYWFLLATCASGIEGSTVAQSVIYVDVGATGANNGTSWTDGYTSLTSALNAAFPGVEIRVAAGEYPGGILLHNGVSIRGGYAGFGEPDPDARDPSLFQTVLGNTGRGADEGSERGYSYHVATASNVDASAVLDGFIISGGNATNYGGNGSGGGLFLENASPTLSGLTFRANHATWDGGGVCVFKGSPTFIDCVFENNTAGHEGGGLCVRDGSPVLTRCTFIGNTATDGGGMCFDNYYVSGAATLVDCAFFGNTADPVTGHGGGLWSGGSISLVNARFSGNAAAFGGAIYNSGDALMLKSSTLSGNAAVVTGGGVLSDGSHASLAVSGAILWNNLDLSDSAESAQLRVLGGAADMRYSCIEGLTGALGGVGNIGDDPLLLDPDGPDDIFGTPDDDLHLSAESPCINAGPPAGGLPPADFEGDPRVQQCRADIGADETSAFQDCNANAIADACDIAEGTSLDCIGNSNGIPDECETDCNENGQPDNCDLTAGTSRDCNANAVPDECDLAEGYSPDADADGRPDECHAEVLYVNGAAAGPGSGASWADALPDLQRALAIAAQPGNAAREIWVAAGEYQPSAHGRRDVSFELRSGLALYGGFAGGEATLDERDLLTHISILTGDLAGDDDGLDGRDENSFHVLVADNVDATARLDGFVIYGGNADGFSPDDSGGGLLVKGGRPTLANCTFAGNLAVVGGGLANDAGRPVLLNCVFSGNIAAKGGGLFNRNLGDATLTNCTLAGNVAADGGGVFNEFSSPALTNCILWGNLDLGASTESAQIRASTALIEYSCIEGLSGALGGIGNIGGDPLFVDAAGADALSGTLDDDLRLSSGSAAIDAGDNDADVDANSSGVQPLPALDRDGRPRRIDDPATPDSGNGEPPLVDMGAYERQEAGVPAAALTGAVSRKSCDLALMPGVISEPRIGGLTELRLSFDTPPGGPGDAPITLEEAICPAPPLYALYAGAALIDASVSGNELVLIFTPGLENARRYRLSIGPEVTSMPGQVIEFRVLSGDAHGDGRVNGTDRSVVVAAWTGAGNFSCRTDLNSSGVTNATDRSIVVGAWTGGENCAP